ncbi:MAG: acyl-CoA dehydrogenase, partial [Rhodospirillaceae bacterium]|nr:acyl-CoA dehydrogenase [Rhodospirillaceae bacterium]
MDLNDRAEHKVFREEVRVFLDENKHLAPGESAFSFRMRPRNLAEEVRTWQGLLVDHGFTSRTIPKEYGGYGAEVDILKSRIIADEFFAASVIQGLGNQGISMLVPTMLEHGTEEQKQRYIRPT